MTAFKKIGFSVLTVGALLTASCSNKTADENEEAATAAQAEVGVPAADTFNTVALEESSYLAKSAVSDKTNFAQGITTLGVISSAMVAGVALQSTIFAYCVDMYFNDPRSLQSATYDGTTQHLNFVCADSITIVELNKTVTFTTSVDVQPNANDSTLMDFVMNVQTDDVAGFENGVDVITGTYPDSITTGGTVSSVDMSFVFSSADGEYLSVDASSNGSTTVDTTYTDISGNADTVGNVLVFHADNANKCAYETFTKASDSSSRGAFIHYSNSSTDATAVQEGMYFDDEPDSGNDTAGCWDASHNNTVDCSTVTPLMETCGAPSDMIARANAVGAAS